MKPNILYLHTHDIGRYISAYGYKLPTPNLQKLAESSTLFRHAFTANPTCSPSRACLLTGSYVSANGMLGLSHRGFGLNDYRQHIIHTLKENGYTTALAGVQHIDGPHMDKDSSYFAKQIGYDEILGREHVDGPWGCGDSTDAAIEYIKREKDQPFFLSCGYNYGHHPFPSENCQEDTRYIRPPAPFPDTPEARRDMAGFIEELRHFDDKVGRILEALENSGQAGNTFILCTTDHGIPFPTMKCNLTHHGTGVMLMMRGPGVPEGEVRDGMVSQIDVFPTICDYLEINTPEHVQGESFLPLLKGDTEVGREFIYTTVNWHAAYEPKRSVRSKQFNYIKRFDGREKPVLPNCDDSISKTLYVEAERWRVQEEQLYDLIYDPDERCNLANDPAYADVLQEMRARLQAWMQETDDIILKGLPLQEPEGAKVTPAESYTP